MVTRVITYLPYLCNNNINVRKIYERTKRRRLTGPSSPNLFQSTCNPDRTKKNKKKSIYFDHNSDQAD